MEVKNFVMMAVTLIIGVILVAGVLTPVISDSIENGNGVSSGSSNYYLKSVSDSYGISITQTATDVTISFEDDVITMPKSGEWELPIMKYSEDSADYDDEVWVIGYGEYFPFPYQDPSTISTCPYVYSVSYSDDDVAFDYDLPLLYDGDSLSINLLPNSISFIHIVTSEADSEPVTTEEGTLDVHDVYAISMSGELVYTENPVIDEDTEILLISSMQSYNVFSSTSYQGDYVTLGLHGTMESFTDSPYTLYCQLFENDIFYDYSSTTNGPIMNTSSVSGGTRIDNVTLSVLYEPDGFTADDISKTYTFTKFIVPAGHEGSSGSGGSGIPSTLSTLLTVVPLLVLTGLVLMTVTYFRRA